MSTDRELLELAARAMGHRIQMWSMDHRAFWLQDHDGWWNPLTDDGDALRLRNRMSAMVADESDCIYVCITKYPYPTIELREYFERDLPGGYASEQAVDSAARRAITRAAAEIGRAMQ